MTGAGVVDVVGVVGVVSAVDLFFAMYHNAAMAWTARPYRSASERFYL